MSIEVQPGTQVRVTLTADPTNEAAAKTLSRVFAADSANRKARLARKRLRRNNMDPRRRGGRIWMVRPKAPRLYQPNKGDACNLRATTSLIRDLQSVSRFVNVAAGA